MRDAKQHSDATDAIFSGYFDNLKRLREARDCAVAIQTKIAEAEEEQERALKAAPDSASVKQQSEDIAAAVALGYATPGEAAKRRSEIDKLEASLAKGLAAARAAGEAISGLERMLLQTQAEIESLEARGRKLLTEGLRARAGSAWVKYFEHARQLYDNFLILAALDRLLVDVGGEHERIANGPLLHRFFIPAFRLNGTEGETGPSSSSEVFSASAFPVRLNQRMQEELSAEITRLRALGVEL